MQIELSPENKKHMYHDIVKLIITTLVVNICQALISKQELFSDQTINKIVQGSLGLIIFYVFFEKTTRKLYN